MRATLTPTAGPLGSPAELMRPERLALLPPTRLSASRALTNRMIRERWQIELRHIDIDNRSRGEAVYRIDAGGTIFEFIVISFEPKLTGRTGRIIGTNWDMMGSLIEGEATPDEVRRAREEIPKLYAGRAGQKTLVWARSNRSLRAFDHTISRLAEGRQPSVEELARVGYLMRNTGLDGNGTFGTRSYLSLAQEEGHPLQAPYHAQMLAAYMMREFSVDLAEHLARQVSGKAARLEPARRRYLGLGNGSALGIVFFANNHPVLIDRWLTLRERALEEAYTVDLTPAARDRLNGLVDRSIVYFSEDQFEYDVFVSPAEIAAGLRTVAGRLRDNTTQPSPATVGELVEALSGGLHQAIREVLRALAIELAPGQADALVPLGAAVETLRTRPEMTIGELRDVIRDEYAWALEIDLTTEGARKYVWYKSRTAEEPRRGPWWEVPDGYNWALDIPGDLQRIMAETDGLPPTSTVGRFLAGHPHNRAAIQRVQGLQGLRYHSPRMNMLADDFRPVQVIRLFNSAFHGLDKTVDFLNRNVLGLLFHGAPAREDIAAGWTGDWFWPSRPSD